MKISYNWLQGYFDKPLPRIEKVAESYTFHSFEIDEVDGDMLDVNVLPNRSADCLSHRGLAKSLSAILNIPMKRDPLAEDLPDKLPSKDLSVSIKDADLVSRYMCARVEGVKIGPSPDWLREAIEAVGQRSINNVVDATNYVMLDIGQPLHAFDATKIPEGAIAIRRAKDNEKITILGGEECSLTNEMLVVTAYQNDTPLAVAGVKGGVGAELSEETTDIIVESANFDGVSVRRTAQNLKLFTDASLRFQNRPTPELVAYGMRDVLKLITKIAGGEVVALADEYTSPPQTATPVLVSLSHVNELLGSNFTHDEVIGAYERLGFKCIVSGDVITVTPPFERTDILIPEDLIEEAVQILGYDRVKSDLLPDTQTKPDQSQFRGIEKAKDQLVADGFTEISTQSFAKRGDIVLANPLDKEKPALRTSLKENMQEALAKARQYSPRFLPPKEHPKLFEIGTVFLKNIEKIEIETSENTQLPKLEPSTDYKPKKETLGKYRKFSIYPFVLRDIALWVPYGIKSDTVSDLIVANAGKLLVRIDIFDTFEKDGRVSYAFRLVFESMEKTLTDEEVNFCMESVNKAAEANGYEVR